jgi:tRNA(Met) cytidine acetyltransferase
VSRDTLASDERALRELFGLLVHAHYRTTPSDLQRMLDAPNLRLHASRLGGHIVAATVVALEGALDEATIDALYHGRRRVRGHALPETLICHSGERAAGRLRFARSVRIATHPALRRRGLASMLVDHVHRAYAPDLFGTMFGATPELLRFRRSVGYQLVRVGASRGTRTGEPAAIMLRPATEAGEALLTRLRGVLARDLPSFVAAASRDGDLRLDADLEAALSEGLPAPAPLEEPERDAIVAAYATGPRTYETAFTALSAFVAEHRDALSTLREEDVALIERRIVEGLPWAAIVEREGLPNVPAAMRGLKRAMRALLEAMG